MDPTGPCTLSEDFGDDCDWVLCDAEGRGLTWVLKASLSSLSDCCGGKLGGRSRGREICWEVTVGA